MACQVRIWTYQSSYVKIPNYSRLINYYSTCHYRYKKNWVTVKSKGRKGGRAGWEPKERRIPSDHLSLSLLPRHPSLSLSLPWLLTREKGEREIKGSLWSLSNRKLASSIVHICHSHFSAPRLCERREPWEGDDLLIDRSIDRYLLATIGFPAWKTCRRCERMRPARGTSSLPSASRSALSSLGTYWTDSFSA